MAFNNGLERRKFEGKWENLRKEYTDAGMSESVIKEMYEFDLRVFNRTRADRERGQSLIGVINDINEEENLSKSSVLKNLSETLTVTDKYSIQPKRFRWIDDIENKQLYNLIVELPERDKEFLTFLVTGYNRAEIAEIRGVKIQSINKKISKFKKLFSTVVSASVVNITNN